TSQRQVHELGRNDTVTQWASGLVDSDLPQEEECTSVSWHHEGKQLVCCHRDGALTTWNLTQTSPTPTSNIFHHGKPRVIIHSSTCTLAAPAQRDRLLLSFRCGSEGKE
ncbi:hypothetical protein O3P69_012791, partial [Scylla paramamosain]